MRRTIAAVLAMCVCAAFFVGCIGNKTYKDGVYTAEFNDYDAYGYKDYLRVTVSGGLIEELVYDGADKDGKLKTEDESYQGRMSLVGETYPGRYTADLINQYMADKDIEQVVAVAGATWSSRCFITLFKAVEERMTAGDTTVILVDNVPEF